MAVLAVVGCGIAKLAGATVTARGESRIIRDKELRKQQQADKEARMKGNTAVQQGLQPRLRFPALITLAMIFIVFVGFGPSFYWKPVTQSAPLATFWVGMHVLTCSAWMLLMLAQSLLVSSGRADLHRKLGLASVVLLPLILPIGWYVAFDFIVRNQELVLVERSPAHRFFLSGSFVGVTIFTVLACAALALRRRPEFHRRIMVLATAVLISAAFARLPVIGPMGPPWTGIPMWILVGCIVTHDIRSNGRLHKANIWGLPIILLYVTSVLALSLSPAFDALAGLVVEVP
jgi:hypothetical protein